MTKVGVALLDVDDNILIVQEISGKYGFPKGRMERCDKNHIECMLRELKEETNINLRWCNYTKLHKCSRNNYNIFIIKLDHKYDDILLTPDPGEILDIRWIPVKKLLKDYNSHSYRFNYCVKICTEYFRQYISNG